MKNLKNLDLTTKTKLLNDYSHIVQHSIATNKNCRHFNNIAKCDCISTVLDIINDIYSIQGYAIKN